MKKLQLSIASITIAIAISFNAFAQQQPSTATKQSPANTTAQNADQSSSPKEAWLKNYHVIKPKLDSYLAHVKDVGTKHPDFSQEVKKLDQMTTDFKMKIDKWDSTTKEQSENYSATMKAFYERIKQQEQKVKGMWDKIHASNSAEVAPKQK